MAQKVSILLFILFSNFSQGKDNEICGFWYVNECNGVNYSVNSNSLKNTMRNQIGNSFTFTSNGNFIMTSDSLGQKLPYRKYGSWKIDSEKLTLTTDSLAWFYPKRNSFHTVKHKSFSFFMDTIEYQIVSASKKEMKLIQKSRECQLNLSFSRRRKINPSWNIPAVEELEQLEFSLHNWERRKNEIILEYYLKNTSLDTVSICAPRYSSSYVYPEFFSFEFEYSSNPNCIYTEMLPSYFKDNSYFKVIPPKDSVKFKVRSGAWLGNICRSEPFELTIKSQYYFDPKILYIGNFMNFYISRGKVAAAFLEEHYRNLEMLDIFSFEHMVEIEMKN
jgi:hypothetical protein